MGGFLFLFFWIIIIFFFLQNECFCLTCSRVIARFLSQIRRVGEIQ